MRLKVNTLVEYITIVMILCIISVICIQAEPTSSIYNIGQREYRRIDNTWHRYSNASIGCEIVPERLIVRLESSGDISASFLSNMGLNNIDIVSNKLFGGYYVLRVHNNVDPFNIATLLENSTLFDFVSFDAICHLQGEPDDQYYDSQQWNLDRISMPAAWGIATGDPSAKLAIIDSGFDLDHEDLDGNIWVNPGEDINSDGLADFTLNGDLDGIDNDGNGYIDDLIGWDFRGGDKYIEDGLHGTCVAGIAVAQTNNNEDGTYKGIAGVAGGWGSQKGVQLMPLRVLTDNITGIYISNIAQAIQYAAENGADVINLSLAWTYSTDDYPIVTAINKAVDDYNCIIVCSSGNSNSSSIEFPASHTKTISVGALTQNNFRWQDYQTGRGSSYGVGVFGAGLDVMAPGGTTNIYTTYPNNIYGGFGGTSAAAPHVSGIVALLRSLNKTIHLEGVQYILSTSAERLPIMVPEEQYGSGCVDAYAALRFLLEYYGGKLTQNAVFESGDYLFVNEDIDLNGYSLKTIGSGFIMIYDHENITSGYIDVSDNNGVVSGLYSSVSTALIDAGTSQKVVIKGTLEINEEVIINQGKTLHFDSTADITLNGNIIIDGGTLIIDAGAKIDPEIILKNTTEIKGYYESLIEALDDVVNGDEIELKSSDVYTENVVIPQYTKLTVFPNNTMAFSSGKCLDIYGTLNATSAIFTRSSSSSWEGIILRSTSNATIDDCIIRYATKGVYVKYINPVIKNCTISYDLTSGTSYGIYNYYADPLIKNNTINCTWGIYNVGSSPEVRDNDITSYNGGLFCTTNSSPILADVLNGNGNNYFHGTTTILGGVYVSNGSNPVVGFTSCGQEEYGRNSFEYSGYINDKLVYNSTSNKIMAEHCWWGSSLPSANRFSSNVDYDPWLTGLPVYSSPSITPENNLFNEKMMLTSAIPDGNEEVSEDLTQYYDENWNLEKKIEFLRYLISLGEATGVADLCKDIIYENPYAPEAFTALDMIYQTSKNEKIKKDIDKDMFKTYLRTFEDSKSNKLLEANAMLLLAGLEKDVKKMEKVYKEHKSDEMGIYALHQLFMYYFHEAEDIDLARAVLGEMDLVYPNSIESYEAHVLMGDEVEKLEKFYEQHMKIKTTDQAQFVSADIAEILPEEYSLKAAYPNPFNPSTTLEYSLPVQSEVECTIFNLSGNVIKEFFFNQYAGTHSVTWNAEEASSGIYLVRFVAEASDGSETFVDYQKVTLLK